MSLVTSKLHDEIFCFVINSADDTRKLSTLITSTFFPELFKRTRYKLLQSVFSLLFPYRCHSYILSIWISIELKINSIFVPVLSVLDLPEEIWVLHQTCKYAWQKTAMEEHIADCHRCVCLSNQFEYLHVLLYDQDFILIFRKGYQCPYHKKCQQNVIKTGNCLVGQCY